MATTRVIGLDIGSAGVRAAELEFTGRRNGQSPTLVRFGQVPLPLGAVRSGEVADATVVSAAIRELWQRSKFSTRDVVIGVGNQRVLVRELDLPWMPLSQVKSSLAFQVQELLPMSVDEALLDYLPWGEYEGAAGRTLHGMLVAAQRDTVNANVLAVDAAGLRTTMVDLNAFALVRSMIQGALRERVVAVVDIGARLTNVVVTDRGVPRFVRILAAGGQDVSDSVAGALGIAAAEAEQIKREVGIGYAVSPDRAPAVEAIAGPTRTLVEAIRNTFVYFHSNNPGVAIEMLVLTGGGVHLPGLGQYIASASRIPVTLGDPLAAVKVHKSVERSALNGFESFVATSVGLAYGVAA